MAQPTGDTGDLIDVLVGAIRVREPCSRAALAESLGVRATDRPAFDDALSRALDRGFVYLTCRGEFMTR